MEEFQVDRLIRLGRPVNFLSHTINGCWINTNKLATTSWGRAQFIESPVTILKTCDCCGKVSTPKKIQYHYCMGFDDLCMSCWNKLKPLAKLNNEAREIKRLTNKLNRERLKCQKLQAQAS